MAKKHTNDWQLAQQRRGAQRPVGPVQLNQEGDIVVSSGHLTAPTNTYDADYAWALKRNGAVSLCFAKASMGEAEKQLASRLEVRFPVESFVRHFWESSKKFHETLRGLVAEADWKNEREHSQPEKLSAKREHSIWSNLDNISRHGTAACFDFYHLAPEAMVQFSQTHEVDRLEIRPMVRVLTTISETLFLLGQCDTIAKGLLPALERAQSLVGQAGIVEEQS